MCACAEVDLAGHLETRLAADDNRQVSVRVDALQWVLAGSQRTQETRLRGHVHVCMCMCPLAKTKQLH